MDHSVVQRRLPPKMRATIRNGRPLKPGLSGLAFATAATPAADHGVVRDFDAAIVLIHRLDAGDGFESGGANVVDHSVVQRCLPPKMRATIRNGRPLKPGLSGLAFSTAEPRQRTTEWSATLPQRSFTSTGLTLATGSKAEVPMSWTTPWSNAACHRRCGPPSGTVEL